MNAEEARRLSELLLLAIRNQRREGHSVVIPANDCYLSAVHVTVWNEFEADGRFRMTMGPIDVTGSLEGSPEEGVAYLTPEEGRRLSDLLPAAPPA